jgi:hypothetical protein
VFELSGVRRDISMREYEVNLQNHREISIWLSTLERKTVWGEAHLRVTGDSETVFQEGIELM